MPPGDGTVVMEDVEIIFRNFSGEERKFNDAGQRNFAVKLDDDTAAMLAEDEWNVKWLRPKEEGEEGEEDQAILPVSLRYDKGQPPRVVIITERGRTNLDESSVEMLDWADIRHVDLIVRPFRWDVNGKTGIKAMLKSIYVTIEEDPLEKKYGDLEEQRSPE